MDTPQLPAKVSGLIVSKDNPFRDDIIKWQQSIKTATRTTPMGEGYKKTKITIIEESEYYPGKYTKIYHGRLKSLLSDLGPYEALLFLHIAMNIDYESEQVLIDYKEVNMNRKTLSSALVELIGRDIIRKVEGKKQWYWVNITMLIIGNISKSNTWDDTTT